MRAFVLGWVNNIDAAGQHSHRSVFDGSTVGGGVDAAGQPGCHDEAGFAQISRQRFGKPSA